MTRDRAHVEGRVRAGIRQLLDSPIPDGLKCDVQSLCILAGVPRATLYRTYPQLTEEFERGRATARETGHQPDVEIAALKKFRTEALSRLAAQHDEINHLRRQPCAPGGATIHALAPPR